MDEKTIEQVRMHLAEIADRTGLTLDEIVFFGSRAREDYRESSDVDILIVSSDFEDVPKAERSTDLFLEWDYDRLPEPEFICLTPEEFEEKRGRRPHIVSTAVDEGISLKAP